MSKVLALFNHKGGVSKTTTAFNLGWAISQRNKKVLLVDADSQCNLTGLVLGFQEDDAFEQFYQASPYSNISGLIAPLFNSQPAPIQHAQLAATRYPNLSLLAGHIDLSEIETQLAVALTTAASLRALKNLPGAVSAIIRDVAQQNQIDLVLLDMSPAVGALNECLLMGSDFFIIPTMPDYFCKQAIHSLAKVIPRWNTEVQQFRDPSLSYPIPTQPPRFMGIISQKYRPRGGAPGAGFQRWINRIKESVDSALVPALTPLQMAIAPAQFQAAGPGDTPYNLINISDFNTLVTQSQKHSVPVPDLSDAQIERQGMVLDNMRVSRNEFRNIFFQLADSVIALTGI
ncbi:ParA family protein [Polyangium fumosum]|uniref:ParA family protein n=1 Tax=Polyangium fumosum TaxID=889272 RepID=A0A4U1IQK9_9BACT|nr:AAA family ATPase [Polyangium fumosum]TKC96419.1 ParA family protein [Polyangium fumosum]